MFEIESAIAHPDHTVTITWSDGISATIDFLPFFERGGWFSPLQEPDYFVANMIVLPGGMGLTWPQEIDYSAEWLRKQAFPFGLPG